jgi:hypothetical protein
MISKVFNFLWPVLLLVGVSLLISYFLPAPMGGVKNTNPSDPQKTAINIVIEVNKFVISTAFLILGFFGSILVGKLVINRNKIGDAFLFSSCVFALISIFLGYYLYDALITHLNNQIVDMETYHIQWIRRVQFFSIVSSAISFIVFNYINSFK